MMSIFITPSVTIPEAASNKDEMGLEIELSSEYYGDKAGMDDN